MVQYLTFTLVNCSYYYYIFVSYWYIYLTRIYTARPRLLITQHICEQSNSLAKRKQIVTSTTRSVKRLVIVHTQNRTVNDQNNIDREFFDKIFRKWYTIKWYTLEVFINCTSGLWQHFNANTSSAIQWCQFLTLVCYAQY